MCNTCGCKKAEETNVQRAEAFWESDSFKDWADEEVREHGDVSFGDWADQEFSEDSHKNSDPLLFEDWAKHEESEMAHQAENEEFCASCSGHKKDAEFELHDWYDPMTDYGMMNTNPVIQEQREEFFDEMDKQRDSYERSKRAKNQEVAIERRMRNINRAIRDDRLEGMSPISRRMPVSVGAKGPVGEVIPKYVKYAGMIALIGFAGYKVASNK